MSSYECSDCGATFKYEPAFRAHRSLEHKQRNNSTQTASERETPQRETCANCGDALTSRDQTKYCSMECFRDGHSFAGENNPNWKGGKEQTECEICGGEFEYYPSDKEGLYCPDCVENEHWQYRPNLTGEDHPHWKGGLQETECAVCNDTVERRPHAIRDHEVHFCGQDCRAEYFSEAYLGENHPNWQGGPSTDYRGDWREVRRQALDRDDHRCVWCGKPEAEIGREPDVHHIVPVRTFDRWDRPRNDAHRLENVVSLCIRCHRRADFGKIRKRDLLAVLRARSA